MHTPLEKQRLQFSPPLPKSLSDFGSLRVAEGGETSALGDASEIKARFPKTFGRPKVRFEKGGGDKARPLKVGVVFSGGQAAGGHNVVVGLFDALAKRHPKSALLGFLGGPKGVVDGECKDLDGSLLAGYRNLGGFDLLGSGRTKIETEEQLRAALKTVEHLALDGLVIIGGDDSNTNAAHLAEFFLEKGCTTQVIGVPKTIDGDLKGEEIEISFGFDTACKTYSEVIGNIARDAISAKKYTHFIKLMGRSASHIALECALQTHPNVALIGEEVAARGMRLADVASVVEDVIAKRAALGKRYGVVLIPEGLIEFIPEVRGLISEINRTLSQGKDPRNSLSSGAASTFALFPKEIQDQLLLERDPHGNVQVSHIATEKLLVHLLKGKCAAVHHFFGYEGRACFPSNFDATYCYALGFAAAALVEKGLTGYMACVRHLAKPVEVWEAGGIPITSLLNLEERKGKRVPVIRKALVDLHGAPFAHFAKHREQWAQEDAYRYPGPIQFEGSFQVCGSTTLTLQLERNA